MGLCIIINNKNFDESTGMYLSITFNPFQIFMPFIFGIIILKNSIDVIS